MNFDSKMGIVEIDQKKIKIKRCPFCGARPDIKMWQTSTRKDGTTIFKIHCDNYGGCGATVESSIYWKNSNKLFLASIREAIAGWNTRVKK